jgi:hypothetical protein
MPRGSKGEKRPVDAIGSAVHVMRISTVTPAMAAGVSDKLWSVADLAEMVDATVAKRGKRGPYKKTVDQLLS